MNYLTLYNSFIMKKRQQVFYNENTHYESHHIQPRSHGGNDHPNNLVWLTRREHKFAHLLLYKIYQSEQMYWALQWLIKDMTIMETMLFTKWRTPYIEQQIKRRNNRVYKKDQAIKMIGVWKSGMRKKNKKEKLSGQFPSCSVRVGNEVFTSLAAAARKYHITPKTVTHRVKSTNPYFKDWQYA